VRKADYLRKIVGGGRKKRGGRKARGGGRLVDTDPVTALP